MRKKKEILLEKKRGRPINQGLKIPTWAGKAIQAQSERSGVASQKILEIALRNGIQLVAEPLNAWIKYQESSEELWNEHAKSPAKDTSPSPVTEYANGDADLALSDLDRGEAPAFERLDDVDERPGQLPEVREDHEVIQSLGE
jgi:hypothetical protein